MILNDLHIYRNAWETNQPLKGTLKFKGTHGNVELILDESLSKKILAIVADAVVASGKEIANNLTAEIIDANRALPAPDVEGCSLSL